MRIEDGFGTGQYAQVDDHGRVYVRSNAIPHMLHHSTFHQNLFAILYQTTLADTSETPVAFFKNVTALYDFEFYIINVECTADCTLRTYFDAEYTSGGSAVTPLNMFRGSGLTMGTDVATIYSGGASADLVLDTTNQKQFGEFYPSARQQRQIAFDGGLNIANSKTAHLTAEGSAGAKVSLLTIASWHDAGTEL